MIQIPQYKPVFDRTDIEKEFVDYIRLDGWFTEHVQTKKFEQILASLLESKYCFCSNNGTITLSLALLAAGILPGDEVLVPDLTMMGTISAVRLIGAIPVMVDVDPTTLCMDLACAEKSIYDKTRALIYVTLNGRGEHSRHVRDFCEATKLVYIGDDAQSFMSLDRDGRPIGYKADISSFSLSMPKIITTGQGGFLTTNNKVLADRIGKLKDFGRSCGGIDTHDTFGINAKFTEMQALLGLSQLKSVLYRVQRKKAIFDLYRRELSHIVTFIPADLGHTVPWFVDIYIEDRDALKAYLTNQGIGSRIVYPPIHSQKCMAGSKVQGVFPVSEFYASRGLWLPCSLDITDMEIQKVCTAIEEFYQS